MLHIVNKAELIILCKQFLQENDRVLLIENAVSAFSAVSDLPHVFALREDILKRNLIKYVPPSINLIDYVGFVELVIDHSPVQSWY